MRKTILDIAKHMRDEGHMTDAEYVVFLRKEKRTTIIGYILFWGSVFTVLTVAVLCKYFGYS
jgi:hypothetical protein